MDPLRMERYSPVSPENSGDYTRTRQMTIGDLLLENRIIFLDGPIHDAMAISANSSSLWKLGPGLHSSG